MRNVVFVAPFFQETTLRLVSAVATLPGVRLGLVSQDPETKLPPRLRAAAAAHYRVVHGLDTGALEHAVKAIAARIGSVDRLLGTLEELQVPLGTLRDRLGIEGMGAESAKNFRDKSRMKSVLQAAGVPCARHLLAPTAADARRFAESVGFPLVAKPPAGSGARSTVRVDRAEHLEACLEAMPPAPERPILLEEFVTGEEHSFDSVCLDGAVVWYSISHYAPSPLEVLREPWIQWCVLIPREVERPAYAKIRDAATRALPALGMRDGLSHMEWFLRPDGRVAISEVGARPPGAQFTKLISYAHDFDLYAAWARLAVFDEFEPQPRPYAAGAAYLRGQGRGQVREVTGLEEAFADLGSLVVEYRPPEIGQSASGSYEGEGYVLLRHPETAVIEEALGRIVSRVRVRLG
jgi:biotin carboxylase